jgi:hypothetical protein
MLKQSKAAFKQGLRQSWKLLRSPFVGAWDEMRTTAKCPPAASWHELIRNDVRAYCAPITGALRGFARARREM